MGRPRTISDEAILAATERTVSRLGPGDLTLAAVAREAGLAPATLVQRFGSKRELLLTFSSRAADGVPAAFTAAARKHRSPVAALRGALVGMVASIDDPHELANHLAFLTLELDDDDFHRHTLRHADVLRAEIRKQLDEAVAALELAACDTRALAERIYITYNGVLISWAILRRGSLARLLRREIDAVLAQPAR